MLIVSLTCLVSGGENHIPRYILSVRPGSMQATLIEGICPSIGTFHTLLSFISHTYIHRLTCTYTIYTHTHVHICTHICSVIQSYMPYTYTVPQIWLFGLGAASASVFSRSSS